MQLRHALRGPLSEHAHAAQHRAVVLLPHVQHPKAVHESGLVVDEHKVTARRLQQVVGVPLHDARVPLQAEQIAHEPVEVRRQVVEQDQVAPLHQLQQLRRGLVPELLEHRVQPAALLPERRRCDHPGEVGDPLGERHHGPVPPLQSIHPRPHSRPLLAVPAQLGQHQGRQVGDAQQTGEVISQSFSLHLIRVYPVTHTRFGPVRESGELVGSPAASRLQLHHPVRPGSLSPAPSIFLREAHRAEILQPFAPKHPILHRGARLDRALPPRWPRVILIHMVISTSCGDRLMGEVGSLESAPQVRSLCRRDSEQCPESFSGEVRRETLVESPSTGGCQPPLVPLQARLQWAPHVENTRKGAQEEQGEQVCWNDPHGADPRGISGFE